VAKFFQFKVTRARVSFTPLTTADMYEIGEALEIKMKQRILDAQTIRDTAAPPLRPKYAKEKIKVTPFPIRNLRYNNNMLRQMRVTRVDQNTAVIFFSYGPMAERMAFNQRRAQQWGVSPSDAKLLSAVVNRKLNVHIERERALAVGA
jgi:hypothetical protein